MSDFVAWAFRLPPGAQNVGQGAVLSGSNQLETANKTLGLMRRSRPAFATVSFSRPSFVRTRTARSAQFQRVFYPKLSASWIISDENFFPHIGWLDQLRLRSAYGASGVQPGATASLQTFSAVTRAINTVTPGNATGTDTPGLIASALLATRRFVRKVCRVRVGFESRLFNNIVNVDFTYYNKKTHDALIAQPIAGSAAPSATSVTRNLGSVQNSGLEATVPRGCLIAALSGGTLSRSPARNNTNKILSLGVDATGKPNPTIGTGTTRDSVGLPANAWFFLPYTYADEPRRDHRPVRSARRLERGLHGLLAAAPTSSRSRTVSICSTASSG
jgi:hypothetical protein